MSMNHLKVKDKNAILILIELNPGGFSKIISSAKRASIILIITTKEKLSSSHNKN